MEYLPIITSANAFSGLTCPTCASHSIRKHGSYRGIQRYRCKCCGRTFNDTINTPLHGIHNKPKMIQYAQAMPSHLSVRKSAAYIGISTTTSFTWRHKILSSFIELKPKPSESPVVVSQITMPHSYKGKRIIPDKEAPPAKTIIATDFRGIPALQLLPSRCNAVKAAQLLKSSLGYSSTIVCQSSKLLSRAVRLVDRATVRHKLLRQKLVQKSDSVREQLTHWMERFHGVATKYLQQYWNWYCTESNLAGSELTFINECFANRQLQQYRRIRRA